MNPKDIISLYHFDTTCQNSKSLQLKEDRQYLSNKLINSPF